MNKQTVRLLICSNSGPGPLDDPPVRPGSAAAGGLVPHVLELLSACGGDWLYRGEGPQVAWTPRGDTTVRLRPVSARSHDRGHYEVISIQTLLWLFHYLHDTTNSPAFDRDVQRAWENYREINREFARQAAASRANDQDTVVLVNDYHLMLVPGLLREAGISPQTRVVYSHHVPWCEPAYFGILPAALRTEVLTSLLCADVLSFHCRRWLDAFVGCCAHYLPARVTGDTVEYAGRRVRLVSVPFPLDTPTVERLADAPAWHHQQDELDRLLRGRQLLARVDRLDLWKNQPRGFKAYAELLDRRPDLAADWCFVAVQASPRYRSPRHEAYAAVCHDIVSEINGRYGNGTVELSVSAGPNTRARALATLNRADAVLINPTYDGFNIVAKEAMFAAERSIILLSVNAGAHEYLAPAVTSIEPFDISGTAAALESILVPDSCAAPSGLRQQIRSDSPDYWLRTILDGGN
ncbi:MAG: trehalose-6-phosphate synthase [Pseudonocardia sp.]